jgi:hypothetical protein
MNIYEKLDFEEHTHTRGESLGTRKGFFDSKLVGFKIASNDVEEQKKDA